MRRLVVSSESLAPWVLACVVGLASGCGAASRVAEDTLVRYFRAVQDENVDALYCLSSGAAGGAGPADDRSAASRETFERWAASQYVAYTTGRSDGFVDLDRSAIVVTKVFTLGAGTFFTVEEASFISDSIIEARVSIRFAYGDIDVSGLHPGTRFYLAGPPLGTVESVRVPRYGGTVTRDVLEHVDVRFTLVLDEAAGPCDRRWTVHESEPIEASAETVRLTWAF